MKAIVLCAGYATRLYPLTKNQPKPLLDVAGKTILDRIVEQLVRIDEVDEIILASNHRFAGHFEAWRDENESVYKTKLTVVDDGTETAETRLGAIGDIQYCIDELGIDDELLVIAGDNLFTYDLAAVAEDFKAGGVDMILGQELGPEEDPTRFAIAVVDDEGRLEHLVEKPEEPRSRLAIYATYFYRRDTVPMIRQYLDEGNDPDAPGHFPAWLYTRKPVRVYQFDGECFDIGTHESLAFVRERFAGEG